LKVAERSPASAARSVAILDAAIQVFSRYGFKKTSMDDLARAAGLSRQGLYLHYATKEALFEATVLHVVGTTRAAARAALEREDVGVEARILDAFEAIHGQAIGQPGSEHWNELLETAAKLMGPVVDELEAGIVADVARVLRTASVAARWKGAGVSVKDLAETLYSTSTGVKHRVANAADYRARMRIAVHIACAGVLSTDKAP
jgi:AcrR family transcriptional regulator